MVFSYFLSSAYFHHPFIRLAIDIFDRNFPNFYETFKENSQESFRQIVAFKA